MKPPIAGGRDDQERGFLRVLRIENWFIGVGVAAVFVGLTAALVLQAGEPAHTVAMIVVAASAVAFVVAVAGYVAANVGEDRAFKRLVPFADVSALMDKHRWDEAIAKLESAQTTQDRRTAVQAWNLLADCYAATGRNPESEVLIRRSIEATGDANENLGTQLACLGVVVRRQGRIQEAEDLMARALDQLRGRDPEATVFVLRNIAYLLWTNGQQDRAWQILDDLPEHDPDQLAFLTQVLEPFAEPTIAR